MLPVFLEHDRGKFKKFVRRGILIDLCLMASMYQLLSFFGNTCVTYDQSKLERFARFREEIFVKRGILTDLCLTTPVIIFFDT